MSEKNKAQSVNNTEKLEKKEPKNHSKEIYWVLGTMLVLVAVFFASYYLFASFNSFQYEDLTFTKEKFGDIPVYHYYYFYEYQAEQYQYNLFLRNDPRKNTVPITGNVVNNGIEFSPLNAIYLSIDPEGLVGCEYGATGISTLSNFLADNQLKVKSASTVKELAEENNIWHATCDIHPNPSDIVIIMKGGPETKIVQETDNCHIIEINNCEVMEAVEKFQVQSILDARTRREANQ